MSNVVRLDRNPQPAPSLDRLSALTADDMIRVNQAILERMQSPVLLIPLFPLISNGPL